jgi:catechol 2,3-dioxygenase-like lactoylglutathione lyase family enzyme
MIDHIQLNVADVSASRRFYEAALAPFGIGIEHGGEGWFAVDELFVGPIGPDAPKTYVHLAFQAADPAMVEAFYKAALAAGGTDNGAPGERPYHPGYYAAFVRDPDGNNIEAVHHGPNARSAASVEITAL